MQNETNNSDISFFIFCIVHKQKVWENCNLNSTEHKVLDQYQFILVFFFFFHWITLNRRCFSLFISRSIQKVCFCTFSYCFTSQFYMFKFICPVCLSNILFFVSLIQAITPFSIIQYCYNDNISRSVFLTKRCFVDLNQCSTLRNGKRSWMISIILAADLNRLYYNGFYFTFS